MSANRVTAWTAFDSPYPAMVSVYRDGDQVTVTVRSERQPDGKEGSTAYAIMSATEAARIAMEMCALLPMADAPLTAHKNALAYARGYLISAGFVDAANEIARLSMDAPSGVERP